MKAVIFYLIQALLLHSENHKYNWFLGKVKQIGVILKSKMGKGEDIKIKEKRQKF